MTDKRYILKLPDGSIGGGITTNDPKTIISSDYVEITEIEDSENIMKSLKYYRFNNDNLVKLSDEEIKEKDKIVYKNTAYKDLLKKITDLESKVKTLETKVK